MNDSPATVSPDPAPTPPAPRAWRLPNVAGPEFGPPAGRLVLALLLGSAGGSLFSWLNLPLPWMLGAVFATLPAALAGAPVNVPNAFRNTMLMVLGVLIGSGFTPDIVEHVHRWLVSIALVLLYTVVLTVAGMWFFRRVAGYDRTNAFFAGLPGGLAAVIFIGSEAGADLRLLSVIHSVRIVVVCFAIPFWIRFTEGLAAPAGALRAASRAMGAGDAALLVVCGVVGLLIAQRLKLAAPHLLGPLFLSAAVHLTGLTEAKPPGELVIVAQVVVGSAIGCRFVGIALRRVMGTMALGLVYAVMMVGTAFAMAWVVDRVTGLGYSAVLLALAPGGLPEMTLIALSLHIDLALVVSHHLVRVLFINVGVPILYRTLVAPKVPPSPEQTPPS